jgi:hypothetical protein
MNTRNRVLIIAGSLLLVFALTAGTVQAQQFEIHPYAGGFFPGATIESEGIYGIRGGVYLIDFIQFDANFGYINNFNAKDTVDSGVHAYVWDVNTSFSLRGYNIPYTTRKAEPFVTFGAGGLTTNSQVLFTDVPPGPPTSSGGRTFFAFNYGGGFKTVRLWGPFGLRGDLRGRTLPNFYGRTLTWFEATGGFNIIWGER